MTCLESPFLVSFRDPCLRAPGQGEPGFRGGPCPGFVLVSVHKVIRHLNGSPPLSFTVSPANRVSPQFKGLV